jgi:hypothetical protein
MNFLKLFIYSHVHTLFGSFPPPAPLPLPSSLPQVQAGPVLPLFLILLKNRHKPQKEDKAFLLVELKIVTEIFLAFLLTNMNFKVYKFYYSKFQE